MRSLSPDQAVKKLTFSELCLSKSTTYIQDAMHISYVTKIHQFFL